VAAQRKLTSVVELDAADADFSVTLPESDHAPATPGETAAAAPSQLADPVSAGDSSAPRSWVSRRKPVRAAAVVLAAAAVFAGWSGYSWYSASHSPSTTYGETRDEALATGRTLVATLNTLDYHQVDAGLSRWLDASTGPLHDELARTTPQTKQALAAGATVATGKVLDAGLSELDTHAGTAKLIASVEVTVAKERAAPATRRNRYAATLTRTASGWKLSTLDQLAVTSS
jgi:Mce-associated membrane protein